MLLAVIATLFFSLQFIEIIIIIIMQRNGSSSMKKKAFTGPSGRLSQQADDNEINSEELKSIYLSVLQNIQEEITTPEELLLCKFYSFCSSKIFNEIYVV